ncbi:MAG: ribosomal RNA small subunit methyltransferase A [Bacilli bacterium]|nr:ribosomal RNA small subunit methyltransferase A [Bacilli bacterium]
MKDFQFKKKFGQNFLKDETIPTKIISASKIPADTLVIEIGPGAAALTQKLAEVATQVVAYEIDSSLEETLYEKLHSYSNVSLIFDDFLKRDLNCDLEGYQYQHLYVVANLPYYITTPILMKLIDSHILVDKIVIMVQEEVGDRFCARPATRDYGSITVFLNYYFKIRKLFSVNRNCFIPRPNVDSVILSLERRESILPVKNFSLFSQIVRDSFQYKRKNIRNNLKKYDLIKIEEVLSKFSFSLTSRAEEFPVEVFVEISNILSE